MDKLNLSFSLLVAYVVPGTVALFAVSLHSPATAYLLGLGPSQPAAASIVPVLLLALACGMCINVVAWALVQPILERTGVRKRRIRYSALTATTLDVYREFVEANFRYYQAYANLAVGIMVLLGAALASDRPVPLLIATTGTIATAVLLAGARDALQRSYNNMAELLGEENTPMTNGHPKPKPRIYPPQAETDAEPTSQPASTPEPVTTQPVAGTTAPSPASGGDAGA